MSTIILLFLNLFSRIYGEISSCPSTQTVDTHKVCVIFQNTNIDYLFPDRDFTEDDYCLWSWSKIECYDDSEQMDKLYLYELNGTLNLSVVGWPSNLTEIDIEQDDDDASEKLYGEWNWELFSSMTQLEELDVENNKFSGIIGDTEFELLASMPSLTDLVLAHNDFEIDFGVLSFGSNFATLANIEWENNSFYGTLNTEIDGFFSHFPALYKFDLYENEVYGIFNNLDCISSVNLPNLSYFDISTTFFSGSVALSTGYELSSDLTKFEIDHNDFSGTIEWNVFYELYNLYELDIDDNQFSGTIDWNIISDSVINGNLRKIKLNENLFTGYANFSWMTDDYTYIQLDISVHCDPAIYPCIGGVSSDRSRVECRNKADCESTCQCEGRSDNYYYDVGDLWSWEEAQEHCQREYGTDLATLDEEDDFFDAIALINFGGGLPPWIGLYSSKDIGWWEWIDGTDCNEDIQYSGMCIIGRYWWNGKPILCEPCDGGSECARLYNGKAANDKQCDTKLSAVLCNKYDSVDHAEIGLMFNVDGALKEPAQNKMIYIFGMFSVIMLIVIILQCILFLKNKYKTQELYSSIAIKGVQNDFFFN